MKSTVLLFGEAEKGELGIPLICRSLPQLLQTLGNPPEETLGMDYAIQALLYDQELIFCRVKEEGFSVRDYTKGLTLIRNKYPECPVKAIFLPGVGNQEIIEATLDVCNLYKSLLVVTEKDLYDYLTNL
jgi:hypothetical protein